jgi:nitrite reductase/ring-hydroxylating ferredoxin subunit
MQRKEFLKTCGLGCLGILGSVSLLESCAGTKYLDAELSGHSLKVPLHAFELMKKDEKQYRRYVVVQNANLQYPIVLYRLSETKYQALLLKCTHQGNELQVFGDRLQCPAHGSEFTNTGAVQNGPADRHLRTFPVQIEKNSLKINLS